MGVYITYDIEVVYDNMLLNPNTRGFEKVVTQTSFKKATYVSTENYLFVHTSDANSVGIPTHRIYSFNIKESK